MTGDCYSIWIIPSLRETHVMPWTGAASLPGSPLRALAAGALGAEPTVVEVSGDVTWRGSRASASFDHPEVGIYIYNMYIYIYMICVYIYICMYIYI